MTDVSNMMASRLEQEEAEQRRKYEEAKKAARKNEAEGKDGETEERTGLLAMKIEVRVEEVDEEGKMEAVKRESEIIKVEVEKEEAEAQMPLKMKRELLKRKSSLGWEAVKKEVDAIKQAAAEDEIAKQESLKEERAEQLRAIKSSLVKVVMETPV